MVNLCLKDNQTSGKIYRLSFLGSIDCNNKKRLWKKLFKKNNNKWLKLQSLKLVYKQLKKV